MGIVFLATVVLVSAKSIKIDQLEYGFCDGADTSVGTIDNVDVQPFPVEVKTGATITISATLTLSAGVQTGSTVSLNIVKEDFVDLPIPCLEIDGLHIGSCSYGVEESKKLIKELDEVFKALIDKWDYDPRASRIMTQIQEYVGCCGGKANSMDFIKVHKEVPS